MPDSKSVGEGESSSNADGTGSGSDDSSTSPASQSASASNTGPTGDPTTDGTTSDPTSGATDPMTGPDTDPMATDGTTGPTIECDIVEVVNDAAQGKMEPDDCGFLMLGDPLATWQAAYDCALDHYNGGLAFTLVAEQQGIDSQVHIGFAGAQGEVYAASRFYQDSGALVPGTVIWGGPCNIAPLDGCTVAQGNLCLDCIDSPKPVTVCETP
jgi:hypothetical protein